MHLLWLCITQVTCWSLFHFCVTLNNLGLLFWWKLCIVGLHFSPPWSKTVPICLALLSLPQAFLEGTIAPICTTHTHTHTLSHCLPLFLALYPLFFPPLPVQAVCQWHTVVLCGGSTSGTAVAHRSAASFSRYRVSQSVPVTLYLYILSLSVHMPVLNPLFCSSSPPLHQILLPLSVFQRCECYSPLEWVSVSSVGRLHVWRSVKSLSCTVGSLTCAIQIHPPLQYFTSHCIKIDMKE